MEDPTKDPMNPDPGKEEAPPGAAQGEEPGAPEEPTLTKTQAEEMVQAARIKLGWDAKTLETRKTTLDAQEQTLKERQDALDAADIEAAKDNSELVDVIKERQKNRNDRAELNKDKAAHAAEIKAANDAKLGITCFNIGTKHKVNHEALKEAAVEYDLKTEEQIESLAKRMAKGETKPDDKTRKGPDSGKTKGGTGGTSDLSPTDKINRGIAEIKNK